MKVKNSKISILCILVVFIVLCSGFAQQEERRPSFVSLYKPSFIRVDATGFEEVAYINTAHIASLTITKPSWANSKTNTRIELSTGRDVCVAEDVFSILRQCNQEIQAEKE